MSTPPPPSMSPAAPPSPAAPASNSVQLLDAHPGHFTGPVDFEPLEPGVDAVVSARHLTKTYGPLTALNDFTLDIPRGSIFGIIGPNGAGKSTAFSILATLLKPTSGAARVCGFDPTADPKAVRKRMGYMPDVMGVYERLTVAEYLQFHAAAYRVPRGEWGELVPGLLQLVDLDVKANSLVDRLSRGMKQRLSLARAMVHDPELLILDEPASGLDPRARIEFRELLVALQEMGKTILISSHILAELQQMCTDIAVIEAGTLLASGSPQSIINQLGKGRSVKVSFDDGSSESFSVTDVADQASLLRRLVNDEERTVVEFTEVTTDLEGLFLQITQGIVQ